MRAPPAGILDEVRAGAAFVAEHAQFVRIDEARLDAFARSLVLRLREGVRLDPGYFYLGEPEATVAYVVTFNAVNFGSGWWPELDKVPGRSGSITIMSRLRDRFEAAGPLSAEELASLTVADCARIFGQPLRSPIDELMAHFASALHDLGRLLLDRYDGSFEALVQAANRGAERFVELLLEMPMYRDVASYRGREIWFLKRAQLTPADLALALGGSGPGDLEGLDRLTIFADNLIPHVLRMEGVLVYDPDMLRGINTGVALRAGEPAEVEVRAVSIHAVERMLALLRELGETTTAWEIDYVLWQAGQASRYKAEPRHRAKSVYY